MKLKKVLLRGVTTFAVLIAVVVIFRIQIFNALEPLITSNMFVAEDTDSYDPGLPIGAQFPPIEAVYEGRQITAIDEFVGTRGALFVANRSVVWWPYCRAQFGQLQELIESFEREGIGLIAITYDSPESQQRFIDAASITYPFLSDIDATSMRSLGIINEAYEPGDLAYGIPYPGIFVLNPEQEIVGKIFIEAYRSRVTAEGTLAYALEVLE